MPHKKKILAGVVFGVAFICTANTLNSDFITDDFILIVENDLVKDFSHLKDNLTTDYFHRNKVELTNSPVGYYRPITKLSFMTDYFLWKLNPAGYHLTNMVMHGLTTLACFTFFLALGFALPISFGAALLFAASPVHSEPVGIVCARSDLFVGLFYVLALVCFLRYRQTKRLLWFILSLVSGFFSYLSKEMGVTLPLAIVLLDLVLNRSKLKPALKSAAVHVLLLTFYLAVRFVMLDVGTQNTNEGLLSGPLTWFFLVLQNLSFSVLKTIFPIHVNMTNSSGFLIPLTSPGPVVILFCSLMIAGILVTSIVFAKRCPLYTVLAWLFLISISPLFKLDSISGQNSNLYFFFEDRWLYLPSVFASIVFPAIIGILLKRAHSLKERVKKAVYGSSIASIALLFSVQASQRNEVFKNDVSLYRVETMQTLYLSGLFPEDPKLHKDKMIFLARNEKDPRKAIEIFRGLLEKSGHDQRILEEMAAIYYKLGEYERAKTHYLGSLLPKRISTPRGDFFSIDDLQNRGRGGRHFALAMCYYHLKEYDNSLRHFEISKKYGANFPLAEVNIAKIHFEKAEYETALEEFYKLYELSGSVAEYLYYIGICHFELGNDGYKNYLRRYLEEAPKSSLESLEYKKAFKIMNSFHPKAQR